MKDKLIHPGLFVLCLLTALTFIPVAAEAQEKTLYGFGVGFGALSSTPLNGAIESQSLDAIYVPITMGSVRLEPSIAFNNVTLEIDSDEGTLEIASERRDVGLGVDLLNRLTPKAAVYTGQYLPLVVQVIGKRNTRQELF